MRILIGLILGCLLTVGAAWIHDRDIDPAVSGAETRRMVNWDVVDQNVQQLTAGLRGEWDRLTNRRG